MIDARDPAEVTPESTKYRLVGQDYYEGSNGKLSTGQAVVNPDFKRVNSIRSPREVWIYIISAWRFIPESRYQPQVVVGAIVVARYHSSAILPS